MQIWPDHDVCDAEEELLPCMVVAPMLTKNNVTFTKFALILHCSIIDHLLDQILPVKSLETPTYALLLLFSTF